MCDCDQQGAGFGLLIPPKPAGSPYPRTEAVIRAYVEQCRRNRTPFYISPEINSRALFGFGFVAEAIAVAEAAAAVAGAVNASKAGKGGSPPGQDAAQIAELITPAVAAKLQAQGISLPPAIATGAVQASLLDSFGSENRGYVILAGGALGVLLLMKLLRR